MKHLSASFAFVMLLLTVINGRAEAQSWIEYAVTGSATVSDREEEVVMCSKTEDGLQAHTLGEWNFTFEAESTDPGTYAARLQVAAPDDVAPLHDDNFRTDDRLSGDGTVTIEPAGMAMGMPLITVRFEAKKLTSDTGASIDVEGTFHCMAM